MISIGHTHPHYVQRIKEQLSRIGFYSNSVHIPQQEELAWKLGQVSGKSKYQLFLCNSGAEANENALKLASFHTSRRKIVAFSKAFHGRTSLAVAATDNANIVAPVNETGNISFLPFNDCAILREHFRSHGNDVAAVIVESIQGVGGINVATNEFLTTIRTLCDEYGAVCIADEVQCGYGRSGVFYAFDHSGVQADIYTMAKGMGNGFPIGGIAIAPHIKPKYGMLGTTFGGNHLACAAALAVLEVTESDNLITKARETGAYLANGLKTVNGISGIRGKGLMIGFDVPPSQRELRNNLLHKHHIFTGEAKPSVIRLLPALNLSRTNADNFLQALKTAIFELTTATAN